MSSVMRRTRHLHMRILLIHTYLTTLDRNVSLTEPLGLICLATHLRDTFGDTVDVKILDLYAMGKGEAAGTAAGYKVGLADPARIAALVRDANPDLVGVHCNFTAYASDAFDVAKTARLATPSARIVMGGLYRQPAGRPRRRG